MSCITRIHKLFIYFMNISTALVPMLISNGLMLWFILQVKTRPTNRVKVERILIGPITNKALWVEKKGNHREELVTKHHG